jgi:hypothetical protein
MLVGLLTLFIVLAIFFGVLSFTVHHLFLIGLVIAVLLVLGHGDFLASQRS